MREAITSNVKIKTKPFKSTSKGSTSSSGLPQYSTTKHLPFWDRDRVIGVGGIAVLLFLIVYGMSGRDNNQNIASKNTSSAVTANSSISPSLSASSIMDTLSLYRWAFDSDNCKKYWKFWKGQDGSYSINIVDLNDTSNNVYEPISSYIFNENYRLDSGSIIKNVIKIETPSAYLDIAYLNGAVPEIRLYRLEDKSNKLMITQGKHLDDGRPTQPRKKCL
jgi:hypothetical protein